MKGSLNKQPEWGCIEDPHPPKPQSDGWGEARRRWKSPSPSAGSAPYNQWNPPAPQSGNSQQSTCSGASEQSCEQDAYCPETRPYEYHVHYRLPRGKAIAAFVLGIVSLFFAPLGIVPLFVAPFITGALAIILGVVSVSRCKRGEAAGKGMAVAGMIFGIISVAGWLVVLFEFYSRAGFAAR
jgi:hypothetical protein